MHQVSNMLKTDSVEWESMFFPQGVRDYYMVLGRNIWTTVGEANNHFEQ